MEYYVLEGEINTTQGSKAVIPRACIIPDHLQEFLNDFYAMLDELGYEYEINYDVSQIIISGRKYVYEYELDITITIKKVVNDELPMCYKSWDVEQYISYFNTFKAVDIQLISALR